MVRTKADSTATGAKAPRKALSSTPSRSVSTDSDGKSKTYGGGNSYHPRETPDWQKPITTFFARPQPDSSKENISSGTSSTDT
ncbi:PCNA-associated factor [Frankliniella fusca]|uniref:PCNA-associated factor n=1 Tax=Frankliniella fusca TaxID=407009 RepID=A0AAE1LBV3_9NEOP|nr:PCNA-associated factor [Frankliniella fusca]